MAVQRFVTQSPGTRFPFRAHNINTPKTSIIVVTAVTYSDIGISFVVGGGNGVAKSIYDKKKLFDSTLFSWLLFAVVGKDYPVLMKEKDFSTVGTVLGADWALLARVADGQCYKISPI